MTSEQGTKASRQKCIVKLSSAEHSDLEALISKGRQSTHEIIKTRILLKADVSDSGDGWNDERIAEALDIGASTVFRTRQRLVEEGLQAALQRKPRERPSIPRIFDGAQPQFGWPVPRQL